MAAAMLSGGAVLVSPGIAAADPSTNATPGSATVIDSVPFDEVSGGRDTPLATDPAAHLVAQGCNGGAGLYGTSWWKYTASSRSTFVVHAALAVGGPSVEEPIGMAVVAGDLASVRKCGKTGTSISDAGAFTLAAGETIYVVVYFPVPTDVSISGRHIGLYPSSGVVPANDNMASATPITTLPYRKTQNTTLATTEPNEPVCYDKFGITATVWYALTLPKDQLVNVAFTTDYYSGMVIAPSDARDQNDYLCGPGPLQTKAGVTYLIGVHGGDLVRNSGALSIEVTAAPAIPTITASIASTGTVNEKKGIVHLTGTITCDQTASSNPVTGTIKQTYKRVIHRQSFTGSTAVCTAKPAKWTAKIKPTTFKWNARKARITIAVEACNSLGCTTATATKKVTLKRA